MSAESHGLGVVPVHYKLDLGIFTVHLDTILTTWIAMGTVILLSLLVRSSLKKNPDKKQTVAEAVVEFSEYLVNSQIQDKNALKYVPIIGSTFIFVLFANWIGLLPWRLLHITGLMPVSPISHHELELASPTNDLNTTLGLAICSVIAYFYYGIKKKGLGYFKHYFTPNPFFFPFNLLEDFTRPLSLSFRLFGNIIGGEILLGILLFLVPWFIPLPIFAFEVFVGFIQAFVFAVLTASYIGAAVAEHHHDEAH